MSKEKLFLKRRFAANRTNAGIIWIIVEISNWWSEQYHLVRTFGIILDLLACSWNV
jgi:hypothetical protein